jgi:hypothetical protein
MPEHRAWTAQLVEECRERLSMILPLNDDELEFVRRLNDEGEIAPALVNRRPKDAGDHPTTSGASLEGAERQTVLWTSTGFAGVARSVDTDGSWGLTKRSRAIWVPATTT